MICHATDCPPSKMVTLDQYCSHTWSPLATNGPTLPGMAFSELVDIGKCTRKDETVQSALGWVFKVSYNDGELVHLCTFKAIVP